MSDVAIIRRDTAGSNILLPNIKKGIWHGLLADWKLSQAASIEPRQDQHVGIPHFSAARIQDFPSRPTAVADEIESFLHVLVYYAVKFLPHNVPDKCVGPFLRRYFEESSGMTQTGELTAPALKRQSMHTGAITLEFCGILGPLQFMCVDDPPHAATTAASGPHPPPNYSHPLNELVRRLLSWFSALYTLDYLNAVVVPDPSQACLGGRVPLLDDDEEDDSADESSSRPGSAGQPPFHDLDTLRALAAKLDDHSEVLKLFRRTCRKALRVRTSGLNKSTFRARSRPEEPAPAECGIHRNLAVCK